MSHRYFLKIEGLNGGSTDLLHIGAFEVESFSIRQPKTHAGACSAGGSDFRITDVIITKKTDPSSTLLFHAALKHTVFKQATLTIDKTTFVGIRIPTVVIKLDSVIVDVVHPRHGFDEITLNFDRVRFEKGGFGSVPRQDSNPSWGSYDLRGS